MVTITHNLHTKQRKPVLICKAGTKAELVETVENGSMVILRIPGWKDLVAIPRSQIRG